MAKTYVIKWTNRYSQESGYVKNVLAANKCFENTWEEAEAKQYKTESAAKTAVTKLVSFGEGENNDFQII